jgi:hypothetical protein
MAGVNQHFVKVLERIKQRHEPVVMSIGAALESS